MSLIDDLLASYRKPQDAPPAPLPAVSANTPPAATGPLTALLTCMDGRIDPARLLGPHTGGGQVAGVIRNAGGRASDDAIRSLIVATRLKGVDKIVVVHHTDCAMLTFTNEDMRQRLAAETGDDVAGFDFLPIRTLQQSVGEDVALLAALPFFAGTVPVSGYILDLETGDLHPVAPAVRGAARRPSGPATRDPERQSLLNQLAQAADQISTRRPTDAGRG